MSASITRRLPGALILLGLFLVPLSSVEAQVADPDARALANHRHAVAMTAAAFINHAEDIPLVAQLHAESAGLRDWNDPNAFDCWRLQAALLYNASRYEEALVYLEDAATLALAWGSPGLAAHAYLDAAGVLNELGRRAEAQDRIRTAHELSTRDELTDAEQRRIQQRIRIR
jgi:tetratricopeptide (TPR) repeat protein